MPQPLMPKKLNTRPPKTNTKKRCPFHHRGLKCKSRKSIDTWSNRQVWPLVQNEAGQRLTEFCQENTLVHEYANWSHEIKRHFLLGRKAMTKLDSILTCFSSSHVGMWELEYKESWVSKNWCFWTMVLENSWESLGQKGYQTSQF